MREFLYKLSKHVYGKWYQIVHKRHFGLSGKLVTDGNVRFMLRPKSKINIENRLDLSVGSPYNHKCVSIIKLEEGATLNIAGSASIYYGADISIFGGGGVTLGDGSFINKRCRIACADSISIGKNCAIGDFVRIMDSDFHEFNGHTRVAPVKIGDHVWIGVGVTILPGVTIGDNAVIGAGSLVNKNIPAGVLAAGVPAHVIEENVQWK